MDGLQLRDIKPLMDVDDYTIYIFIGLVILGLFVLLLIIYYLYRFFKKQKDLNLRRVYTDRLKNVDLSKTKEAAYEITYCLQQLEIEPKNMDMANNLIERLAKYKYKKEVDVFDEDVKSYYHLMLEVLASE